jgi:hypothetical protein
MEVKLYLAHEQFQLLEMLALEGGETVQQLMLRLILKEDFERHISYDAMRGQFALHECYCNRCFLKGHARTTQKMHAVPKTKRLEQ